MNNLLRTQKGITSPMKMKMMPFIKTIAIKILSRRSALKTNKLAVRLTNRTLAKLKYSIPMFKTNNKCNSKTKMMMMKRNHPPVSLMKTMTSRIEVQIYR